MKLKQVIFKVTPVVGRTHFESIVTDDSLDVYQKAIELGYHKDEAKKLQQWIGRAQPDKERKEEKVFSLMYGLCWIGVICRDPGPGWKEKA